MLLIIRYTYGREVIKVLSILGKGEGVGDKEKEGEGQHLKKTIIINIFLDIRPL